MSLLRTAQKGAAVTLVGQAARFILQAGSMVALARLLDADDFGVVAMVTAVTGLALVISDFGLSLAYVQAEKVTEQERTNLYWLNLSAGVLLFCLSYAGAEQLATLYRDPRLVEVCQALSFVFLLTCATAQHRADLSRQLRFEALARCDVLSAAVSTGVAVLSALNGAGYWALVWQQITMALVSSLLLVWAVPWAPSRPRELANLKPYVRFGINTSLVQILNYATSNVDSVLIGRRWGATELGYYDRAYQLFKVPLNQIAAPMTRVAVPVLSRSGTAAQFRELLDTGRLALVFSVGLLFLFVSATSSFLVPIVFGPGWTQSAPVLSILTLGGFFQALTYPYFWVFLSRAETGLQLRFSVFTKVIAIALMIIGSHWGILGVASAAALGSCLNWLILTCLAMPRLGLDAGVLLRTTLIPVGWIAVPALLSYALSFWLNNVTSIAGLSACAGIYTAWILGTLTVSQNARSMLVHAKILIRSKMQSKKLRDDKEN